MYCTNCSSPVRPIVSFDIDGTMGDYHNHFCHFAATYLGYAHYDSDYDGHEPFKSWFCRTFNVDLRSFRDIKLAYRQGGQKRSMPVSGWARVACKRARDLDAEVWVTTTRPYMRLDNIDPDTRFWLQRHGIKYDYLIYGEHKYEELSRQVDPHRVVFVIDDLADQVSTAMRFFGRESCFLYRTMWNHHFHELIPGLIGSEVTPKLEQRIGSWNPASH